MLVQGVRGSQSQPDSPSAQLSLIAASQNFLQVSRRSGLAGLAEGLWHTPGEHGHST